MVCCPPLRMVEESVADDLEGLIDFGVYCLCFMGYII